MLDRRLLYAVSTAKYGSFTAAAERVGVTQSAVTKGVADLEAEVGFAIFERTARGVFPTKAGRSFVERAERLLDDAQNLMRTGSEHALSTSETLRIGVCPTSIEWLLSEPLVQFMSRFPDVRVNVMGGTPETIIHHLRTGSIDIAVGDETALSEQPDFDWDRLGSLKTVFFARKAHPLLSKGRIEKADLANYDLILPSMPFLFDVLWKRIYEDDEHSLQERLHIVDFFPMIARFVRSSDAISVAFEQYLATPNFAKYFAAIPTTEILPLSPICIATRKRWSIRPPTREFVRDCRTWLLPSHSQGE